MRNLLRHKVYSSINILGLAVGMAACMVIAPQVLYHLSFDRFNPNYERICRVSCAPEFPGQDPTANCGSFGWTGRDMQREYPGGRGFYRMYHNPDGRCASRAGETEMRVGSFCYGENSIFELFSFEFKAGDPAAALSEPTGLVFTGGSRQTVRRQQRARPDGDSGGSRNVR